MGDGCQALRHSFLMLTPQMQTLGTSRLREGSRVVYQNAPPCRQGQLFMAVSQPVALVQFLASPCSASTDLCLVQVLLLLVGRHAAGYMACWELADLFWFWPPLTGLHSKRCNKQSCHFDLDECSPDASTSQCLHFNAVRYIT